MKETIINKATHLISATKFVLLLIVLTTCFGFTYGLLTPDQFMPVVTMVVGWYFGSNSNNKREAEKESSNATSDLG